MDSILWTRRQQLSLNGPSKLLLFIIYLLAFLNQGFSGSTLGYPGTRYVDQVGLRDPPVSASVLGLKAHAIVPVPSVLLQHMGGNTPTG